MSAQDDLIPTETKVPRCVACPHPALDHEYDGWGFTDDRQPFDWMKCFDSTCDCRVKVFIHPREVHPLVPQDSTAAITLPSETPGMPPVPLQHPQAELAAAWAAYGYTAI